MQMTYALVSETHLAMPSTNMSNAQLFIASGIGLHCSKVRPLPALKFSVSSSNIVLFCDLSSNLSRPVKWPVVNRKPELKLELNQQTEKPCWTAGKVRTLKIEYI